MLSNSASLKLSELISVTDDILKQRVQQLNSRVSDVLNCENEYQVQVVDDATIETQPRLSCPKLVGGAPSYEISDTESVPSTLIKNDLNVKNFSECKKP